MKVRTRIAPSPTGDPHIGTLYQAIFDYAFAKKNNGEFILRIEDTDRERFVTGSEENIINSLKWAGINPDEGPFNKGDFAPYRQSERLDIYKKYIYKLIEDKKAYYCFCTKERLDDLRQKQIQNKIQSKYDKFCLSLPQEEIKNNLENKKSHVIRLNVKQGEEIIFTDLIRGDIKINTDNIDDQIIMKSDGFPTYHAAVVIDDHLMKITHIIRGEEWISSTPKHILLYKAFEWNIPYFAHLSLLRNRDKSKIAKRESHTSINWYRDNGYLPEALINYLILLGWSHPDDKEIFSMNEFISKFSFERVNKGGPIFDLDKLTWMNGVYIRSKSIQDIKKYIKPYLKYDIENQKLENILKLVQDRLKIFSEINSLIDFFCETPNVNINEITENFSIDIVKEILEKTIDILDKNGINHDSEKMLRDYAESQEYNIGNFFMVIRLAITGKKATPPLIETMDIIGIDDIKKRILTVINYDGR
jgi:glutamyl-tRNA synthetase